MSLSLLAYIVHLYYLVNSGLYLHFLESDFGTANSEIILLSLSRQFWQFYLYYLSFYIFGFLNLLLTLT